MRTAVTTALCLWALSSNLVASIPYAQEQASGLLHFKNININGNDQRSTNWGNPHNTDSLNIPNVALQNNPTNENDENVYHHGGTYYNQRSHVLVPEHDSQIFERSDQRRRFLNVPHHSVFNTGSFHVPVLSERRLNFGDQLPIQDFNPVAGHRIVNAGQNVNKENNFAFNDAQEETRAQESQDYGFTNKQEIRLQDTPQALIRKVPDRFKEINGALKATDRTDNTAFINVENLNTKEGITWNSQQTKPSKSSKIKISVPRPSDSNNADKKPKTFLIFHANGTVERTSNLDYIKKSIPQYKILTKDQAIMQNPSLEKIITDSFLKTPSNSPLPKNEPPTSSVDISKINNLPQVSNQPDMTKTAFKDLEMPPNTDVKSYVEQKIAQSSLNTNIKGILPSLPTETTYLIVHPNGTIEQTRDLNFIKKTVPNYTLVDKSKVSTLHPHLKDILRKYNLDDFENANIDNYFGKPVLKTTQQNNNGSLVNTENKIMSSTNQSVAKVNLNDSSMPSTISKASSNDTNVYNIPNPQATVNIEGSSDENDGGSQPSKASVQAVVKPNEKNPKDTIKSPQPTSIKTETTNSQTDKTSKINLSDNNKLNKSPTASVQTVVVSNDNESNGSLKSEEPNSTQSGSIKLQTNPPSKGNPGDKSQITKPPMQTVVVTSANIPDDFLGSSNSKPDKIQTSDELINSPTKTVVASNEKNPKKLVGIPKPQPSNDGILKHKNSQTVTSSASDTTQPKTTSTQSVVGTNESTTDELLMSLVSKPEESGTVNKQTVSKGNPPDNNQPDKSPKQTVTVSNKKTPKILVSIPKPQPSNDGVLKHKNSQTVMSSASDTTQPKTTSTQSVVVTNENTTDELLMSLVPKPEESGTVNKQTDFKSNNADNNQPDKSPKQTVIVSSGNNPVDSLIRSKAQKSKIARTSRNNQPAEIRTEAVVLLNENDPSKSLKSPEPKTKKSSIVSTQTATTNERNPIKINQPISSPSKAIVITNDNGDSLKSQGPLQSSEHTSQMTSIGKNNPNKNNQLASSPIQTIVVSKENNPDSSSASALELVKSMTTIDEKKVGENNQPKTSQMETVVASNKDNLDQMLKSPKPQPNDTPLTVSMSPSDELVEYSNDNYDLGASQIPMQRERETYETSFSEQYEDVEETYPENLEVNKKYFNRPTPSKYSLSNINNGSDDVNDEKQFEFETSNQESSSTNEEIYESDDDVVMETYPSKINDESITITESNTPGEYNVHYESFDAKPGTTFAWFPVFKQALTNIHANVEEDGIDNDGEIDN